ncbi:MAG: AAA family ATPase [Deltaproteobacteria bacterium]|nr:AAA family ATPase [Deltaproteobacteria bacterium]
MIWNGWGGSPRGVRVEGLRPIPRAEVELGHLTLITGENNRGKSWLASLIWGLHQAPYSLWTEIVPATREALITLAQQIWAEGPVIERADYEAMSLRALRGGTEDLLAEDDPRWLAWRDLCAAAAVDMHAALLTRVFRAPIGAQVTLTGPQVAPFGLVRATDGMVGILNRGSGGGGVHQIDHDYTDRALVEPLVQELCLASVGFNLRVSVGRGPIDALAGALYLPAARTGLVQALPILAENLIGEALGDRRAPALPSLPAPTVQLLRLLVNPGQTADWNTDLVTILEERLLRGRVHRAAAGIQYEYQPAGTTLRVPMGRSSAVVTELLPLVLTLQRVIPPSFLVYEEPEAHLHPELQRQLARVLVRMARRGTRLLITTHSDVFVQEINNCVKVGALRARGDAEASLGPGEEEAWLAPDEVRAYEFGGDAEGQTEVRRLEVLEEGVVAPMFNRSIADQMQALIDLDERLNRARST